MVQKKCMLLHLSLMFYTGMGDPISKFSAKIQTDIIPKGTGDGERRPIAHGLYARVLHREAKAEIFVEDVAEVLGVYAPFDL